MDDLISKEAALNAIDCWHIDFNSMDGAKVQTDCWRAIKELPTINAIPVEWLREFDLYYAGISGGTKYMNELVETWQKEQEAK